MAQNINAEDPEKPKKRRKNWRPFAEAREFARLLGLKSYAEWSEFAKSGAKPDDIPAAPNQVYEDEWRGWPDWLGKPDWRPFAEAREFVRSLKLPDGYAWQAYANSDDKPKDIPAAPRTVYEGEWRGWPDWLGKPDWRPFVEAREYVRSLGLKSQAEWNEYAKSGDKPDDIPSNVNVVYKDEWRGMPDWLGNGYRQRRPFEEARDFIRSLGLKNQAEWREYAKSGAKPDDIPASPDRSYKDAWQSWGDWLGTGRRGRARLYVRRPFEDARAFVRSLGLKSQAEWNEYVKSGEKPADIPSNAHTAYKDEWRGMADWLGTVNAWNRAALLALLEDIRPNLESLDEKELYTILSQSGAMPQLQRVFAKGKPGSIIRDLKENAGKGIETAVKTATESELEAAATNGDKLAKKAATPEDVPAGAFLKRRDPGALPTLVTAEGLRVVDAWASSVYGLDDETAEYLVGNRVAALWNTYINVGAVPVEDALSGEGGYYFSLIRDRFHAELGAVESLPVPDGWAFRPDGYPQDAPPVAPNLMQRRTAYEVATRKRVGNWSGVGSGKTIAGVLSSRVTDRRHTLIITNRATLHGWHKEIRRAFPDSIIHHGGRSVPSDAPSRGHHYTLINYDRFQLGTRGGLVRRLLASGVDFVILDEVQLVKQRDRDASKRRQAVESLIANLAQTIPDLHVLGLSATPVINNLTEARKLLEIVTGRSFADLNTQATASNALAVHRALMVYGLRYRPDYETEIDLERVKVSGDHLLGDLVEAEGVLGVEQALLPAKLEAVRSYIRPGTLIYSHYVDGMIGPLRHFVEDQGYTVGLYTGADKSGLEPFLKGRADVLIGSKPVGTGLDGLQVRCDRIIEVSLPWTSAEQEQLEGRIRRQGAAFSRVSVVVPEVVLEHKGDEWSWDRRRVSTLAFKRTLSDCAVDGQIPEAARMSPELLLAQSRIALDEWIERVKADGAMLAEELRPRLELPLPPEEVKRLVAKRGDFTTLHNRWVSSRSKTVHARLAEDPEEWYLYHSLYRASREAWPEVPAEHIAEHLKARPDLVVADFGCGECLLKEALGPAHTVRGFDHVAIDDTVEVCDMAATSLDTGSVGAAVFSLSLMGTNWRDYLAEAHRVLQPFGLLFVAEPVRRWEAGALEREVEASGFDVLPSYERAGFLYVRAVRRS